MKKNYQITYGYRAVITVNVKAETEEELIKLGKAKMELMRSKVSSVVNLEDDSYNSEGDGILDISATWDLL